MEEKEIKKLIDSAEQNYKELKEAVDKKADAESIEGLKAELSEKLDTAMKIEDKDLTEYVKEIQTHANELEEKIKDMAEKQGRKIVPVSAQILEALKAQEFGNKLKNKGMGHLAAFEIKAANIDTGDINSGTIQDAVEPGVSKAPWRPTPIWDNVSKGVIGPGRDSISWWEETTRTDSADFVAEENAPAAGSAKTFTKQNMTVKVVKDYTKVSEEALEDFEYMQSEIQDLMQNGIPRHREGELLSGAGTGNDLKGIDEYYKTFAKPANMDLVDNPNVGDVLAAAILQCQNGNTSDTAKQGFMPNLILLNPGDATNLKLVKSAVESYVHHPLLSMDGQQFNGIRIATSLDLTAGQFIVGDFSRAKVYVKRDMRISFHYENEDDVLNGLVLVLASQRLAGLKVSAPDAYAFVGGTFSVAKPLIASS